MEQALSPLPELENREMIKTFVIKGWKRSISFSFGKQKRQRERKINLKAVLLLPIPTPVSELRNHK